MAPKTVKAKAAGQTKKADSAKQLSKAEADKRRISAMINWCNFTQQAKKSTPEDVEEAKALLEHYRAFNGSTGARMGFVEMFEKCKGTKKFPWAKTYVLQKQEVQEVDEGVTTKYMTRRSAGCEGAVVCCRL